MNKRLSDSAKQKRTEAIAVGGQSNMLTDDNLTQTNLDYLEALLEYARRNPGRFHVPGHKGGPAADPGMLEAFGSAALALDIPALMQGIDVGPEPTPFQRAQELAAEAWGAKRTWFLINGASHGHDGIGGPHHERVARLAQARGHGHLHEGVRVASVAPREDPEREPARRPGPAAGRLHNAAEAAADHHGAVLGEQPPYLLGRPELLSRGTVTRPHHRHVQPTAQLRSSRSASKGSVSSSAGSRHSSGSSAPIGPLRSPAG